MIILPFQHHLYQLREYYLHLDMPVLMYTAHLLLTRSQDSCGFYVYKNAGFGKVYYILGQSYIVFIAIYVNSVYWGIKSYKRL